MAPALFVFLSSLLLIMSLPLGAEMVNEGIIGPTFYDDVVKLREVNENGAYFIFVMRVLGKYFNKYWKHMGLHKNLLRDVVKPAVEANCLIVFENMWPCVVEYMNTDPAHRDLTGGKLKEKGVEFKANRLYTGQLTREGEGWSQGAIVRFSVLLKKVHADRAKGELNDSSHSNNGPPSFDQKLMEGIQKGTIAYEPVKEQRKRTRDTELDRETTKALKYIEEVVEEI